MKMTLAVLSVLLLCCTVSFAQVEIGELPTLFHEVSGRFIAMTDRRFCIENFNYDGLGPDAFLYFYYPGDPIDDTGGGVTINITAERAQFQVNRRYTNEQFCFDLPESYRGCDFEGFGIWCRYANQLFTNITWTTGQIYSETAMAERITCVSSPGRGYVGMLPTQGHDVSGQLYIRDNKTFVIRDFTYDGQGPDAFVYLYRVGMDADPQGGGIIIPLSQSNGGVPAEEGRFEDNRVYAAGEDDFVIPIPASMDLYTCDVGYFTIWCRDFFVFFTTIRVDGELFTNNPLERDYETNRLLCNRPSTQPGIYLGELPTDDPRVISGSFYIQDQSTFIIQLFSYDASRDDVFMYVFPTGVPVNNDGSGGTRIPVSDDSVGFVRGRMNSFYNQDFTVDLSNAEGGPVMACDLEYFAIIDTATPERLTKILIPQDIFSETATDGKIMCGGSMDGVTTDSSSMGLLCSTLTLLGALLLSMIVKA